MEKPSQLSAGARKYLLKLARTSLEHIFKTGKHFLVRKGEVPKVLSLKGASFVTLTKNGELRGCIGRLEAARALYLDVIENTYAAAFDDYRFPQLLESELPQIKIEISVLTKPQPLPYKTAADLPGLLIKYRPGVILQSGFNSATFLPQVWEQLPDACEFLHELCLKAGLQGEAWREGELLIFTYQVENFQE